MCRWLSPRPAPRCPLHHDGSCARRRDFVTRLPALPDGRHLPRPRVLRDFELVSWHVLFAKAANPGDIVNKLHGDRRIMSDPDIRQLIENHD